MGVTPPVDPLEQLRRARPEAEIQRAILSFCRTVPGVTCWRQNTRTVTVPGRGGRMRPMFFGFPGLPDILGWVTLLGVSAPGFDRVARPRGVFLAIEVKRAGAALRPAQARFLEYARKGGVIAFRAESVDDVVREFRAAGILA